MSRQADLAVIARDPALPGLAALLDAERFASMLRPLCPGREIGGVTPLYLRYKPGTSCLASYMIDVNGEPAHVYARCHRDDQGIKLQNANTGWEIEGDLGPGLLVDEELSVAVFGFPNDYEVRGLRKLYEPAKTPVRLGRILPAHPHLHNLEPELLRYKPERRFVGLYRAEAGPSAVLRLYTDQLFAEIRDKAGALRNTELLRVPRVIGQSGRYAAVAYEWVEGHTLDRLLPKRGDHGRVLEDFGAGLHGIHRQRPRLRTMVSREDYARAVRGACSAAQTSDPDLGSRASSLAARVARALDEVEWCAQVIHGDLTADQVVVGSEAMHLIDLDRACFGDPRVDIGAFAAGLRVLTTDGSLDQSVALASTGSFLESYWRSGGIGDWGSVRPFIAAALLLMAPEPFRCRRENWPELTGLILDAAEGVLADACVGV